MPGYTTATGTVTMPTSLSETVPTRITTTNAALAVYADPTNNGAYANWTASGTAFKITLYPARQPTK